MRVLYVEDDVMNRKVMRAMLAVAGAELIEAGDAETGLRLVGSEELDFVLMDLRMPGMDGLTAIKHIRSRPDEKANLPIIVVTADAGRTIRSECIAHGADEVLLKPVAMKDLFDTIGGVAVARATLIPT